MKDEIYVCDANLAELIKADEQYFRMFSIQFGDKAKAFG